MKTKFSLQNKVIVLTGGGSGIGSAIATTFAAQGAEVHILDFNMDAATNTVAENAEIDKTKLNSVETKIRGKKDYLEAFYCSSADEAIKAL